MPLLQAETVAPQPVLQQSQERAAAAAGGAARDDRAAGRADGGPPLCVLRHHLPAQRVQDQQAVRDRLERDPPQDPAPALQAGLPLWRGAAGDRPARHHG